MPETEQPAGSRVLHTAGPLSLHLIPGAGVATILVLHTGAGALAWVEHLAGRMGASALAIQTADGDFAEDALAALVPHARAALAERHVLLGAGAGAPAALGLAEASGAAGVLAMATGAPSADATAVSPPCAAVMAFDPRAGAATAMPEGVLPVPLPFAGAGLPHALLVGGALPLAIAALLEGDAPYAAMALRVARLASPPLRRGLAARLTAAGQPRRAEAVLAVATRPWAPDTQGELRVRALQRLGRHAEALELVPELIRRQPRLALLRRRAAALHFELGQPARAAINLKVAAGAAPLPFALQRRWVRLLLRLKNLDEAVAAAEAALAAHPGHGPAEALLGEALLAAGRREDAAEAFARAVGIDPTDGAARRGLAVAGDAGGRDDGPDELLGGFIDAMVADCAAEQDWLALAALLAMLDRPVAVRAVAERAMRAVPSAALAGQIAQMHEQGGQLADAEAAWRQAVALAPADPAPWLALSALLARGKRHEEAATVAAQAAVLHPQDASLARRAAESLLVSGNAVGAEREARRALAIDAVDAAAHLLLADALWRQHRGRDAVRAAETGLFAVPDSQPLRMRLGFLHLMQNSPAAAASVFRDAVRHPRSTPDAWLGLSDALWRAGEVEEAGAAAREGLAAFPSNAQLRARLAQLLLAEGDAEAAQATLAEVVAEDAGSETVRLAMADALWRQGRRAEALAAAREVAAAAPDDPAVAARLGHLLLENGDVDEAVSQFERAIAAKPDLVPAWTGLCDAERTRKRIKPAIEAYRRAEALGMDRMTRRLLRFRLFGELEE